MKQKSRSSIKHSSLEPNDCEILFTKKKNQDSRTRVCDA